MATKIGLDLGYAYITLSDVASGISRESSIALVDKTTNTILALGDDALCTEGAERGIIVRPFKNGLLYFSDYTRAIVANAVKAVMPTDKIRCVVGLPSDFVPKQEKALFSIICQEGVAECYGVTRSVAALIGAGYAPNMSVISVNVGASATDISVLYRGEVILSACESIGGEDFDRAVKQYIADQGGVSISLSVARAIKEKLGAVWPGHPSESIDIEGTLSLTGNTISMNITTEDILSVFDKPLQSLLRAIADTVKQIPYEQVEEIFNNGIVLSGGMAELYGLDKMIEKVIDISVTLPRNPMDCVARGLSRIHTFLPVRMPTAPKNITSQIAKYYETKNNTRKKG